MKQRKLFVWHDVLTDYTSGVIFALAYTEEEARRKILASVEFASQTVERDLCAAPKVYGRSVGFAVWGGG